MKTRAFGLVPMTETVYAIKFKGELYPYEESDNKIFIKDLGWKNISKKQKIVIDRLPDNWTAKDIKNTADKYGVHVVFGLLRHPIYKISLYKDSSFGADYEKAEIINMIKYGEKYDKLINHAEYFDKIFADSLLLNFGFCIVDDYLCLNGEDADTIINIDRLSLHPINYINSCLKGYQTKPNFDVIKFDDMLERLLNGIEDAAHYCIGDKRGNISERIVSVSDRVAFICGEEGREKFMELMKMLRELDN